LHNLALEAQLRVVPVGAESQLMTRCVPAVALKRAQIHAADVGDPAVDGHRLLVVIVAECGVAIDRPR
jgi:hypothetical protein